ncbi:MAG: tRNA (guanosine(37)-N1)-methyltransferase TrmD [Chthoniobacterales bacterium]
MQIQILTPFPGICQGVLGESILKRAQKAGSVQLEAVDLRAWATDKHRTLDAPPYGGGPGMVMKIEPIEAALTSLRRPESKVIFMSPQGKRLDQKMARSLAQEKHLIFLCGHYEGVDQRVIDHLVDEEISIGDYVLTNGALAALVVTDAVVRLLPGVLGDDGSAPNDSFEQGLLDFPHYTRPEEFHGWTVPSVLLSGNHAAIDAWRQKQALEVTRMKRPDLFTVKGLKGCARAQERARGVEENVNPDISC